jgi:hypothetical protein
MDTKSFKSTLAMMLFTMSATGFDPERVRAGDAAPRDGAILLPTGFWESPTDPLQLEQDGADFANPLDVFAALDDLPYELDAMPEPGVIFGIPNADWDSNFVIVVVERDLFTVEMPVTFDIEHELGAYFNTSGPELAFELRQWYRDHSVARLDDVFRPVAGESHFVNSDGLIQLREGGGYFQIPGGHWVAGISTTYINIFLETEAGAADGPIESAITIFTPVIHANSGITAREYARLFAGSSMLFDWAAGSDKEPFPIVQESSSPPPPGQPVTQSPESRGNACAQVLRLETQAANDDHDAAKVDCWRDTKLLLAGAGVFTVKCCVEGAKAGRKAIPANPIAGPGLGCFFAGSVCGLVSGLGVYTVHSNCMEAAALRHSAQLRRAFARFIACCSEPGVTCNYMIEP